MTNVRDQHRTEQLKRRDRLSSLALIFAFLVGLTLISYPLISDYVFQRNVVDGATSYQQNVGNLSDDDIERMREEARAYNNSLKGDPVEDPFVPGSGVSLPENYTQVLDTGDGVMAYIIIPRINVYLPIRHGTSDAVLDVGAGHIRQSALPIGGVGNNPIITAHTGHRTATLFSRLIELEVGDTFEIMVLDEILTYRVFKTDVIVPHYVRALKPDPDKDIVTLLTCTPYGINSHRLLVFGERIPTETAEVAPPAPVPFPRQLACVIVASLLALILVLLVARMLSKRMESHNRKR